MARVRRPFVIALLLVGGGCLPVGRSSPPQPDAASSRWRAHVGCYQMGDGQFALDSVPDLKLNADRPGVRRARFGPTPAVVGGYWFVTSRGALWLFRHDGLWGRSFEFTAKGDSLVGRGWVRTDVPSAHDPPERAVAVRTASCRVPPPAEAQSR
ncbi:MAG TPA: hypothetical protein VF541_18255 [Longimicrobium sp.]|jgi:hypothetical protein